MVMLRRRGGSGKRFRCRFDDNGSGTRPLYGGREIGYTGPKSENVAVQGTATGGVTMKSVRQLLQAKGREVHSITPDARVFDALKLMADKDVGALVVLEGGRLAGILSERDYARKVILEGKSSHDITVRDIMTAKVHTVTPDQTVEDCMSLMTGKRVRHLPVIEGGRLAGLLSIGDLVKEVIAEQEQTIRQLESYIHS
jgi:CBS domain-containing protein